MNSAVKAESAEDRDVFELRYKSISNATPVRFDAFTLARRHQEQPLFDLLKVAGFNEPAAVELLTKVKLYVLGLGDV